MKSARGDTGRQASLRQKHIHERGDNADPYVARIGCALRAGSRLLDVGCGTGHIVAALAADHPMSLFVGLDLSLPMLRIAGRSAVGLRNVLWLQGNGLALPAPSAEYDIVINRLAECSRKEAWRVLKVGGRFLEYGLGPDADQEIAEAFAGRCEQESFFRPNDPDNWQEEIADAVRAAGFSCVAVREHKAFDYYGSEREVEDLIEMVPLVVDFDRQDDQERVRELADRHRTESGIAITWHYYIVEAQKHKS